MIVLEGKSVFGGIAIGKIVFHKINKTTVSRIDITDTEAEIRRFWAAMALAKSRTQKLYEKALERVSESDAKIFEVHKMILEDSVYVNSVIDIITNQRVNAEYAVGVTANRFVALFENMDDEYMQGRAADIKDVAKRLLKAFSETELQGLQAEEPVIIAADDLAPSETIQLDKEKVLAFITTEGSVNSHTAILARTMNIPAIVSVGNELKKNYDGKQAVVDGFTGKIYIEPDEETMREMLEKKRKAEEEKAFLEQLKGKENITTNGQKIEVYANIGDLEGVEQAIQNDAGGIGLFRSELLYLERETFPTEEEQFYVYKRIAERMKGKKVVIRTLDIGVDKQVAYFGLPKEENPALGYRAIRFCLSRPDVFKPQLRAIYRASAYGNISIIFPMIISLEEVNRIKTLLEEVKTELRNEHVAFDENLEIGIMIETPAAVMISRVLAKEVDFFGVGTNDLTQYILAIDRQNQRLDEFYDDHHPAILAMIRMAAESAHAEGKWIGICGELAADLSLTETFLEMQIDELSVAPGMILPLRKKIREL